LNGPSHILANRVLPSQLLACRVFRGQFSGLSFKLHELAARAILIKKRDERFSPARDE
jgi:hypothetical protein